MRKLVTLISLLLLPLLSFAEDQNKKELKVAALLGLTGAASYHADAIMKGISIAADELKSQGWKIDLKFEDDQTNSAKTATALNRLVVAGYKIFIGPTWSFQVNAIKSIIARDNLVALVPGGSSEINGGAADGVFNLVPPRTLQTPLVEKWLKENKFQKGFILTPNGDWGEIHRQVFKDALKGSGKTLLAEEQFDYGIDINSLSTILLKASQAGADIVFTTGAASDVANVVRARNSANLKFAVMSTKDIVDAANLKLVTASDLSRDVYTVGTTVSAEFTKKFKEKYQSEPGLYSDRGYDALMLVASLSSKSDGSAAAIKQLFNSDQIFNGISGDIRFNKNGDIETGEYRIAKAG